MWSEWSNKNKILEIDVTQPVYIWLKTEIKTQCSIVSTFDVINEEKKLTEHKRARNAIETEMDNSYEVAIEQK